jgi:hypothetical protein
VRTWSLGSRWISAELAEGLADVFDEGLGILPGHEVAALLVGLGVDRAVPVARRAVFEFNCRISSIAIRVSRFTGGLLCDQAKVGTSHARADAV